MIYVDRDEQNQITSYSLEKTAQTDEMLPVDHPDVIEYLSKINKPEHAKKLLVATDEMMVRVIEDLVFTLEETGVLDTTKLPLAAREKLAVRKHLRNVASQNQNNSQE